MREHFTISVPNSLNLNPLYTILVCALLSFIIVFPILGFKSATSVLSFLLLGLIIYVIITSMTNENLANELPSTLYPGIPHTGLDGISLTTYVNGMDIANKPTNL
jgi:ABC-type branched-subunit amino acid transport system permease subunit